MITSRMPDIKQKLNFHPHQHHHHHHHHNHLSICHVSNKNLNWEWIGCDSEICKRKNRIKRTCCWMRAKSAEDMRLICSWASRIISGSIIPFNIFANSIQFNSIDDSQIKQIENKTGVANRSLFYYFFWWGWFGDWGFIYTINWEETKGEVGFAICNYRPRLPNLKTHKQTGCQLTRKSPICRVMHWSYPYTLRLPHGQLVALFAY